jgi:hypothetical protein
MERSPSHQASVGVWPQPSNLVSGAVFPWRLPRSREGFRTVARALAWLAVLAVVAATLSPATGRPHFLSDATAERVGAHFLIGFLFCLGYRRRWPTVLVLGLTATAGLEAAQLLVDRRHAEVADALFKMSGFAGGLSFYSWQYVLNIK